MDSCREKKKKKKTLFGRPDTAADAVVTSLHVQDLPRAELALPCNQAYLP